MWCQWCLTSTRWRHLDSEFSIQLFNHSGKSILYRSWEHFQSLQRYLYELLLLGTSLHISFSTLDRVAWPERTSGTAELLTSTFSIMLYVLQDSVAIAKLSGRKTQSFLNFFFQDSCWNPPVLKKLLTWSRNFAYKERGRAQKRLVYFSSLIC